MGPWETDPPDDPAETSLSVVIRNAEQTASRRDDDENAQIAVRVVLPGLRAIAGQLAHEHRVSYTRFVRYAIEHGLALLDAHPAIIAVRDAYDLTRASAMSTGDRDALRRLNQVTNYEFQQSQELRTSFRVSREVAARVSDLAMVCGIEAPRLAVVILIIAVLTLPNNRGYREGLIEEVKAFHRHLAYRRRVLTLGRRRELGDGN